jgi:hypothetical protein
MPTRTIAGKNVQVNEEGYLTNPAEWTQEIAVEIAKEEGLAELTPVIGRSSIMPARKPVRIAELPPPCAPSRAMPV